LRRRIGRSGADRLATALALAVLLAVCLEGRAGAQSPADDRPPLARYVPKDELVFFFEFDGVDAHADAWRRTAAYKILNDTTAGAMLEDLLGQLATKIPQLAGKVSAPEAVAVVKHLARSGFVIALGGDMRQPKPRYAMIALRDAFKNKDVRPAFARALQGLNAPNTKPQGATRAGHKVVAGKLAKGNSYSYWIEETRKEDLILVLPTPESADIILETLDGKRPGAIEHPSWIEVSKAEGGFTPVLKAFTTPWTSDQGSISANLGLINLTRLDLRGGFQEDALAAILRVSTPKPHSGLFSILDGPTFDRSTMPALPAGQTSYTVTSLNVLQTFDKFVDMAKKSNPGIEDQVKQAADAFKAKTKLRLREDVLAHLGPKLAWYVLPAKSGAPPTLTAPTAVGMQLAMLGIDQIPKAALVLDIDNPTSFGKVLDELMGYVNREIRARSAQMAGAPGADAGAGRGGRNRGPGSPSVEFRLMTGESKGYVMSVPPELSTMIPAAVRPTIRIAGKQLIIAMSPEVARMAQEAKPPNNPPSELASAFAALSPKLKYLAMADPRDTLPAVLAGLPGKLQAGINSALIRANVQAIAPTAGAGSTPAAAAAPSAPGGGGSGAMQPGVMPGPGSRRGNRSGEPTGPSAPAPAPAPAAAEAAKPAPGVASVVLQVDPAKLPSADAIRSLLFPSLFTLEEDGDGFKATYRAAFPDLGDPSKGSVLGQLRAIGQQRAGGNPPPGLPPGLVPPPASNGGPVAGQPGAPPASTRPGAPGGRGAGGNAPIRPD